MRHISLRSLTHSVPHHTLCRTVKGVTETMPRLPDSNFPSRSLSGEDAHYPYLLACIKGGVSFHKVINEKDSVRVGGSPIGSGTFLGLLNLLCREPKTPFDAFLMAQQGDQTRVDMLVSDIYGGDYGAIGLKGSLVASSLGKMQRLIPRAPNDGNVPIHDDDSCVRTNYADSQGNIDVNHPVQPLEDVCSCATHTSDPPPSPRGGSIKMRHRASLLGPPLVPTTQSETANVFVNGIFCRDVLSDELRGSYESEDNTARRSYTDMTQLGPKVDSKDITPCDLPELDPNEICEEDVAQSLLNMTTHNIALLAHLLAKIHRCSR